MVRGCYSWKRRLYVNRVLAELERLPGWLLSHVLDEAQLILPAQLILLPLVLL